MYCQITIEMAQNEKEKSSENTIKLQLKSGARLVSNTNQNAVKNSQNLAKIQDPRSRKMPKRK